MFKKFLSKVFGVDEILTNFVTELEYNDELDDMTESTSPYRDPAYINIKWRKKEIRIIQGHDYELLKEAKMSNSVSKMNAATERVMNNPSEIYDIVDHYKDEMGVYKDVYVAQKRFESGRIKFWVGNEGFVKYYNFSKSLNLFRRAKLYTEMRPSTS